MKLFSHAPTALLAALGLGATAGAWRLAWDYEHSQAVIRREAAFEDAAYAVIVAVERELAAELGVVHALSAFYASSQVVDAAEFRTFTAASLERHPGLVAVEWAPRVRAEEVEPFLVGAAALGVDGLALKELAGDGEQRPVAPRPEYFPVLYVEPLAQHAWMRGVDLGEGGQRRATLERAVESGEAQAMGALSPGDAQGTAFLSVAPVYARGVDLSTVEARRAALQGFVAGTYEIGRLSAHVLQSHLPGVGLVGGVDLYLYPDAGEARRAPVYVRGAPGRQEAPPALALDEALRGLHTAHRLPVEGQSWLAVVRPVHLGPPPVTPALAWTVLLSGLALTGATSLAAVMLTSRADSVAAQVEARTAQLAATTRELAERERHVRAIVENTVDGIITIDDEGTIRSVNPAVERMFGYRVDEMRGQPLSILMPEPHGSMHEERVRRFVPGQPSRVVGGLTELTGRRADGTMFPLELTVSVLRQGDARAYLGVLRDISERKAVDRMKDEFIATVSHELRTPLTSILGSLELVRDGLLGPVSDQAARMIEVAYDSGERLVRLINDILDMERFGTGGMRLRAEVLDCTELLELAAGSNHGFADMHGVVVARELPTGMVCIRGDRDRLLQVLTNLIGNAVKFSPPGGRVLLSLARRDDQVVFTVSDTGPGIPEEFQSRVFQPFSQADATNRRGTGGTGLGLSIAKAIVEAHGGTIWFETSPAQGTSFSFSLQAHEGPPTHGAIP